MIASTLPPELHQFVEHQIATGRYHSEEELVVDAVRVLRQIDDQRQAFRDSVQQGLDQLARGDYTEYDDAGLAGFFDGLKRRALNRENPDTGRP